MLQQNERFQNDVKNYSEKIEMMPEGQEKTEAKKLLNDLIFEVRNIDNTYLELIYAKQLPSRGNDMREKITAIRKQLDTKISRL